MFKKAVAIGLPILILALAYIGMKGLMSQRSIPKQTERIESRQPVEIAIAERAPLRYEVYALGRTVPSKRVRLQPQVTGLVTELGDGMTLGGLVREGESLLVVDPADYRLAVRQAAAQVGQAIVRLREEEGRGEVAQKEWSLLRKQDDEEVAISRGKDLALRKPQLESAQLNLEAANAALSQAKLALQRTQIKAPMNAVVVNEDVEIGQRVSPNQPVATLVGTDQWWIQVALSPSDLRRVTVEGVRTRVYAVDPNQALNAKIIRTLPELDSAGKLVRLLIGVDDPMQIEGSGTPLFLGDSVNVVFDCPTPEGLVSIPRRALRPNGQIWQLTKEDTPKDGEQNGSISLFEPSIFHKSPTGVLMGGLSAGTLVVKSNLSMVTNGTKVRWRTQDPVSQKNKPAVTEERVVK